MTSPINGDTFHNFTVLASLEENECLQTQGRRFSKLKAPDRFFKNAANPLSQLVHKIITLVFKIFHGLKRVVRGENADLNLSKVEELKDQLLRDLDREIPEGDNAESYIALCDLSGFVISLDHCVSMGLPNYQKAFNQETQGRIEAVRAQLCNQAVPKVKAAIKTIKERLYESDKTKAEQFFSNLFDKKDIDLSLTVSAEPALQALTDQMDLTKSAVKRALTFYGLENAPILTGEDLAALTIGIIANITEEDLKDSSISDCLCEKLVELRRNVDHAVLKPYPAMSYGSQLEHDQKMVSYLNKLEEWKAEESSIDSKKLRTKELKQYSYAEYLARYLSYALFYKGNTQFSDGLLVPMYDAENQLRLFSAHKLVSAEGLHGALLRPVGTQEKSCPVHVVFRGTYCFDSLCRDFSPNETMKHRWFDGPGRYTFSKYEDNIYTNIIEHIKDLPNLVLEFHGHSLGASDAMRTMEYFMLQQAKQENGSRLPVIKYALNAFNTPAVEPDIAERFIESVETLKAKTDLRYFDEQHDLVRHVGCARLGYCRNGKEFPEHLHASVFIFNRNVEEMVIALAKNVFKRTKWNLQRAMEAHTFCSLSLHEENSTVKLNPSFIQEVYTNHREHAGIQYGEDLGKYSEIGKEEVSNHLLTRVCFFGREIKRKREKVSRALKSAVSFPYTYFTTPAQA